MRSTPLRLAWDPSRTVAGPEQAADETERVRLAASGDPAAQAWLMTRVVRAVRTVARALLRRQSDADDAAQQALLEILGSARTYSGDGTVEAWARRIAARVVLRHARRERRQPTAAPGNEVATDELVAPDHTAEQGTLPRSLREYLDDLPEVQRHALLLHHALGYTVAELAELTEVSAETVRSRLRLGIAALRKRVRQELLLGARRRDA